MTNLTDTQTTILSLAAQHEEGASLDHIKEKVSVANPKRAADALVKRGLLTAEDLPHESGVRSLPGYRITAEGKEAIGIEDEPVAEKPTPKQRKGTDEIMHEAGAEVGAENRRAEAEALAQSIADGSVRATEGRLMAIAEAGVMPPPPDFTADTHKPFRKKLGEVQALAEARDVKGLTAYEINPRSSSPKAIDRYRRAAIVAIERGA